MTKPPNLKAAHECGDCRYYVGPQEGQGRCKMYNWVVGEDEVCDSWEAGNPKDAAKRLWASHRRRLAKDA
jgi:hypothetical protein